MKLLYIHPDWHNLGDTLVEAGAKFLIHEAIGWHHFHQTWLPSVPTADPIYYDSLVLVGTPWFWSGCKPTEKYGALRRMSNLPCAKRLALGVGSSFPLGTPWEQELPADPAWHRFSLVAARDSIAQNLCPKSVLMCCPSLFCAEAFGVKPSPALVKRVLVYASLDCRSVSADFLDQETKQEIEEEQRRLIYDQTDVITMNYLDHAAFDQNYPGRKAMHITDPEQLLKVLAYYEETVSLRVHACAAALSLGRRAKIWPIDTRAHTVTSCGAETLRPLRATEPICVAKDQWVDLIRSILL